MNVLIGLIILSAFLQSSFVGVNLVLLLLVTRSFIVETKANYFLAFFAGILVGVLSAQNTGFWPLVFLVSVLISHLMRKLPFNRGILTVIPVIILTVLFSTLAEWLFFHQTVNWYKPQFEIITGLPIFIFLNFWEDRFMYHSSGTKLKLRK